MIDLKDISFQYKKNKPIFAQLDLKMKPGHIYGFLGKNGAGKTTLMKILSGLLFPKTGECSVLGHTPRHRTPNFLSEIYFIPEDVHTPDVDISVYEKLYAPFYPNFNSEQFQTYLKDFEVDYNTGLKDLSYGQKKKVILSFGMAANCRLLIMDEPTNGLDIPSKAQFRKMLARTISDEQTFIISTHQVKDLTNLIDAIIILEKSKIIFHENVENISKKLHFGFHQGMTAPEKSFYAERAPGGFVVVKENEDGNESEIEMEALFNAVMNNQTAIQTLFIPSGISNKDHH